MHAHTYSYSHKERETIGSKRLGRSVVHPSQLGAIEESNKVRKTSLKAVDILKVRID